MLLFLPVYIRRNMALTEICIRLLLKCNHPKAAIAADLGPLPSPLSKDCVTLAEIFKQNGYKTAAVSSNYGGAMSKDFQLDQGFDDL